MAYSPYTASAGDVITAARWNTHVRDNVPVMSDWTPTITQGSTVSHTVSAAREFRSGDFVWVHMSVSITGSGTGSNPVEVTGFTHNCASPGAGRPYGSGLFFDSNFPARRDAVPVFNPTGEIRFRPGTGSADETGFLGDADLPGFDVALASNDFLSFTVVYEGT